MTGQRIPVANRPRKPAKLGLSGARLWRKTTQIYTFRPDELRILEDACREADLVDDLTAALVGAPKLVKGSQGQLVINPIISEVRQHRNCVASLLKQLKLTDVDSAGQEFFGGNPRAVQARAAANARWRTPGRWDA